MAEKVAKSFGHNRSAKCARRKGKHLAQRAANKLADETRKRLSPAEQLAALDFRLGAGVGAKRERFKLNAKIMVELAKNH